MQTATPTPEGTVSTRKSIEDRVLAAFSHEPLRGYAPDTLATLRENLRQLSGEIRQSSLFLLLLVLSFELIGRAAVAEISLGPVKLNNLIWLYTAIPLLVAYFCHNLLFLSSNRRQVEELHAQIVRACFGSQLTDERLLHYLIPHYGSLVGDYAVAPHGSSLEKKLRTLAHLTIVLVSLGFVIFEIYAFFRLFLRFGMGNAFVWISLLVTTLLFVRTALLTGVPDD